MQNSVEAFSAVDKPSGVNGHPSLTPVIGTVSLATSLSLSKGFLLQSYENKNEEWASTSSAKSVGTAIHAPDSMF